MKTLEAKPFDQNSEIWKRENRLFISTVLEAGASGQNRIGTHALRSHRTVWFVSLLKLLFLVRNWHCWSRKAFPRQMTPKAEKKLRKRPFFDTADRHERLYGRSRLYASAQGRHETSGVLSLFSRLSLDFSIKNSVQMSSSDFQGLFRVKIRKMAQGSDDLSTLPFRKRQDKSGSNDKVRLSWKCQRDQIRLLVYTRQSPSTCEHKGVRSRYRTPSKRPRKFSLGGFLRTFSSFENASSVLWL